jgi:hypothetical protein
MQLPPTFEQARVTLRKSWLHYFLDRDVSLLEDFRDREVLRDVDLPVRLPLLFDPFFFFFFEVAAASSSFSFCRRALFLDDDSFFA